MTIKKHETSKAPIPSKHISQVAISPYGMAYLSGQISQDSTTGEVIHTSVSKQTDIILSNIKIIVESLGATIDDVVKCNCFVSSMEEVFEEFDSVYKKYFNTDNPPARQTVAAKIYDGLDVEISCEVILRK